MAAAAESRLFTFPRNADAIQSQTMPQVATGWTSLTRRHWPDLATSPNVPHFDRGVPAFPAGVDAATNPQAKEYYACVEKLAPFWPSALALFLATELKASVGDQARFERFRGMIEEGLKEGDFRV